MTDAESQIKEVRDMLQRVQNQLVYLAHVDGVFWQVQAIIRDNPEIASGGIFQDWIGRCYVDSVTAGLRHLADRTRNVVSLWRVFEKMVSIKFPLTKEWYLSLHDGPYRRTAEKSWADLVGESKTCIEKHLIRAKQKDLDTALKKVSDFARQHVAHIGANPSCEIPLFDDVRQSIVAAFRLYWWCSLILTTKVRVGCNSKAYCSE